MSEPAPARVVFQLGGARREVEVRAGETLLAAALRVGLAAPFACQSGHCGTCAAKCLEGAVTMEVNDVFDAGEVAEGWVLTCQARARSAQVVVDYDAA